MELREGPCGRRRRAESGRERQGQGVRPAGCWEPHPPLSLPKRIHILQHREGSGKGTAVGFLISNVAMRSPDRAGDEGESQRNSRKEAWTPGWRPLGPHKGRAPEAAGEAPRHSPCPCGVPIRGRQSCIQINTSGLASKWCQHHTLSPRRCSEQASWRR